MGNSKRYYWETSEGFLKKNLKESEKSLKKFSMELLSKFLGKIYEEKVKKIMVLGQNAGGISERNSV